MARGRPITSLEPLDQRVQLMMTATELASVDAWAAGERIRSRSEAIRRLIELGLEGAKAPRLASAVPSEEGVFEAAKRVRRG